MNYKAWLKHQSTFSIINFYIERILVVFFFLIIFFHLQKLKILYKDIGLKFTMKEATCIVSLCTFLRSILCITKIGKDRDKIKLTKMVLEIELEGINLLHA